MTRILEHCCFRKYLSDWWAENEKRTAQKEDFWNLIHYGDHSAMDLLGWCFNMCGRARVTIAAPFLAQELLRWLDENNSIAELNLLSREVAEEPPSKPGVCVNIANLHTQLATIEGAGRYFTLQGGLLQAYAPGKYITTMGVTKRAFDSIGPILKSWIRLYSNN